MAKIQQLQKEIIAKIAAGEVIERPSFAVKELIDNAIDARADVIEIIIEEAGLKSITVTDNGEGMPKEDVLLSFLPHTTSKISDEDHPQGVTTLGFRGEALSSIAAISTMTIKSRPKNAIGGTQAKIKDGQLKEISPIGMPVGTSVTVEHLFHAVPARKKFLKTLQTEFRHITEIVIEYALSYPTVHFLLIHNKKTILDLPQKEYTDRLVTLLGESTTSQLFPLNHEEGYITLQGFIGHPQIASKNHQKQYIFINNRVVQDKLISLAVKESFGTLLLASNTPVFLLHLTIPQERIDVNVHPRKEQVAFVNTKEVFDAVKQAVTQTLHEHNLTFRLAKFKEDNSAKAGETTSFSASLLKQSVLFSQMNTVSSYSPIPLAQVDMTYILCKENDSIVLFDQHALHERILYERFTGTFSKERDRTDLYELPRPLSFTFAINEIQIIEEFKEEFTKLGFNLEHFQGSQYLLRFIPSVFKGRKNEKIIKDMIDDLSSGVGLKTIDLRTQRMLAFLSCRAAVKAGDTLTLTQMEELISQFPHTANNATCPHGRPTMITIQSHDLKKLFKRL